MQVYRYWSDITCFNLLSGQQTIQGRSNTCASEGFSLGLLCGPCRLKTGRHLKTNKSQPLSLPLSPNSGKCNTSKNKRKTIYTIKPKYVHPHPPHPLIVSLAYQDKSVRYRYIPVGDMHISLIHGGNVVHTLFS